MLAAQDGQPVAVPGPFERTRQHQFSAKCPEYELSLGTGVLGQEQLDLVSLRGADHRIGDAGVA